MKDPAFLFYPNDYLGRTMGLTFEEKGAYMELLMMQFNRGHMTSHMIGQAVGQLWDKIKEMFVTDDLGLYYDESLEQAIEKRRNYVDSRKNNKLGINQYTNKDRSYDHAVTSHMTGHTTGHMVNENRNENEDVKEPVVQPKSSSKSKRQPARKTTATKREIIYPDDFENWWRDYPLKLNKADSFRQWVAIEESGEDMYNVFIGTKHYVAWFSGKSDYDPQYWKHPNNFLKEEIYKEWMNGAPEVLVKKDPSQGKKFVDFGEVT